MLKPVIAGKNWFMVGCEFYNLSGFGYDACLKGVSRKKYRFRFEKLSYLW